MRLSLRTFSTGIRTTEKNYIKNTYFVSNNHINKVFYPVPEFVDSLCSCDKKGIAMTDDFMVICPDCMMKIIGESTLQSKEEFKTPNIEDVFKKLRLQWSVGNKDNWYTVSGRNIIPDTSRVVSREELEKLSHDFMIKILIGNTEIIDGDYDKDKKQLRIYL